MSPIVLYELTTSYYSSIRKGIALLFLLLFLGGFTAESLAYHYDDYCQSELVDLEEGEKDSEEDKKEKEKEDKLLNGEDLSSAISRRYALKALYQLSSLSQEIQEVLSPPPELS